MADYWLQNKPVLANAFRSIKQTASSTIANANRRQPLAGADERPEILIYPTYSHLQQSQDLPYSVSVRGWLFTEGDPNRRRNKLLLATTERFIGGQSAAEPEKLRQLKQELIEIEREVEEDHQTPVAASELVRERLAPFFRKSLPLGNVEITLEGKNGEVSTETVVTDTGGRFEHSISLPFVPQKITARHYWAGGSAKGSVSPLFIGPSGVSVISDIDDTVRLTGILAGKRDTLRNVLATPHHHSKLEGVSTWYQHMHSRGACFHYVSNSPWQMFDSIHGFLGSQKFPSGSVHLKRYQGVIDGIFEPVANRKTKTLTRIFRDFPHRKFVLVGDGGELDLETYVQTARSFPNQVLAIYIRDLILPKEDPLEINDPLDQIQAAAQAEHEEHTQDRDLIDLDSVPVPPPLPPRPGSAASKTAEPVRPPKCTKPGNSQWRQFDPNTAAPPRKHHINWPKAEAELMQPTLGGVAGALLGASSRRGAAVEAASLVHDQIKGNRSPRPPPAFVTSSQDYSDYERIDKERRRIDNWKARVIEAKRNLPVGIELKMWRTPADVESSALKKISSGPDLL